MWFFLGVSVALLLLDSVVELVLFEYFSLVIPADHILAHVLFDFVTVLPIILMVSVLFVTVLGREQRYKLADRIAEGVKSTREEKYRRLFNAISDAIYVHPLPKEGEEMPHFSEVNDAACAMLGQTPALLQSGELIAFVSTGKDVTEKILIESKLKESEQLVKTLAERIRVLAESYPFDAKAGLVALLEGVDQALYEAKQKGRNRVESYEG